VVSRLLCKQKADEQRKKDEQAKTDVLFHVRSSCCGLWVGRQPGGSPAPAGPK